MNPIQRIASEFQVETDACSCAGAAAKPNRLQGHVVICSDWQQCLVVQELMACCARTYGFEDFAIRKATKEALANAFKHGNRSAPEKCIRIDYEVDESEFRATISDEGYGFNHEARDCAATPLPTESGRGLGLMRHYMTVRFNDVGNRVELSKRR